MQGVTLNPTLLPLARSSAADRRATRHQTGGGTTEQTSTRPVYRFDSTTEAELKDSLRRYVRYSEEYEAGGKREALPLRNQRALDAYVGTRRDEEKAFLHQTLGIDSYA